MKIKRLRILRMPGFPDGGPSYDDLADGLNVIVGPNASGKTTTCQAIRGLLWEDMLSGLSPVWIESTWTNGDETIRINQEGDLRSCRGDAPPLPPEDLARCFTVTIDDLFEIKDTGRAEAIVQALAGGYDLSAVRTQITGFKKNAPRNAYEHYVDAKRHVRAVQQAHEGLRGEEDALSALRRQVQDADKAKGQLDSITTVRKLNVLLGQMHSAEALLASFPPGMDRLGGKEDKALATLRGDIDDADRRLQDASGQVEKQESRQARADLPEGEIASECLDEQQRHLAAMKEAERDVRDATRDVAQARKKRDNALRALGAIDADTIDALDTAGLDNVETFHRSYQANHNERSAVEARLALIDEDETPGDVVVLGQGAGILREWLEGGPRATRDTSAKRNAELVLVLSALLGVTAVTFALTVNPWWASLVVPAALAVVVSRLGRPGPQSNRRAERETAFERTGLDAPAEWSPDAVGQRIGELERAIAGARQAEQHASERRSLGQRLEQLATEAEKLDARHKELIEQLGLKTEVGTLPLTDLATNLKTFREASVAWESARERAGSADDQRCDCLGKVNAFLSRYHLAACDTYDATQASFDGLKKRAEQYADAGGKLLAARGKANEAQKDLEKYTARKGRLFEDVGLADDDEATLNERLDRLGAYRKGKADLGELEARKRIYEEQLADAGDLTALSPEALDQREQDLSDSAAGRDETLSRITSISNRIEKAKAGHDLGDALAAVEAAEAGVDEQRTAALRTAAGAFLLDAIETEYRTDSEPPVLRQARDWFARFTHYRYELQADADGSNGNATFRALETMTKRKFGLDELSRGTRMQLLLAVRLAFAAAAEQGTQLPFILDEVLSSSDPERFRAIVECLLVLVGQGRQVFYFTCQPGDAEAWREAAEAAGIDEARLIDLGEARPDGPTAGALSESTIRIRKVPAPDGASLGDYAKTLGAAPLSPAAGAAPAHLAHLVDDAEQLYRLAQARVQQAGPLRSLASDGRSDAYIAPDALARVLARAELLDAFADARAVGRGRPLTREDLTAAGVTGKFIDAVSEIAGELDWDAEQLIEAIQAGRVKRFRSTALDTMRDWMHESGHLSTGEPLDEQATWNRVLVAANQHVKSGVLTADEVRRLFETWWRICTNDAADRSETS